MTRRIEPRNFSDEPDLRHVLCECRQQWLLVIREDRNEPSDDELEDCPVCAARKAEWMEQPMEEQLSEVLARIVNDPQLV